MLFDYRDLTPEIIAQRAETGLAAADRLIDKMLATPSPGTFDTIMRPIEALAELLIETNAQSGFLANVGDESLAEAGAQARERLEKWAIALVERDDFGAAVLAYAASSEAKTLDPIRARLLSDQVTELRRSGYGLPAKVRTELSRLSRRLVELESAFDQNIEKSKPPLVATAAELAGLPTAFLESLEPGPKAGEHLLPINGPVYSTITRNSPVRHLRERIVRAWLNRAAEVNEPVLDEMIRLRRRAAALLGYPSWAHFQIEQKMAKTPERVEAFFAELLPGLAALGKIEAGHLSDLLEADTGERTLQAWDVAYYDALMHRDLHGLDSETVAAYFPLDGVLAGFFSLTGELLGLTFTEIPPSGAWHPLVRRFAIDDVSGVGLGILDVDLFPRPGKFGHAAAVTLREGYRGPDGKRVEAYSALLVNLPAPTKTAPSLLRFEEVRTVFHELGHVLHQCLSQVEFPSQAGTSTLRDFVEAPSQIMENFLREPAVLRRFARHYQTGEPIPEALVRGLVETAELNAGLFWLRQLYLARVDLALHGPEPIEDVRALCRSLWADTLRAYPEGTFELASFGHLAGGYDAGYYGYAWARVRGDDMWSRFAEAGVVDPAVGADYRRTILERGGSADPTELMHEFLGRETSNATFLRLRGLPVLHEVPGVDTQETFLRLPGLPPGGSGA